MTVAAPGFVNLRLADRWLASQVDGILDKGPAFADSDTGAGRRVQVEFVSANPTGPLHVGNGRWASIGDSLARVLQAAGYRVEREYLVNDAGTQAYVFAEPLADGTLRFHFAVENPQGLSARAFAVLLDKAYSGAPLDEVARSAADPTAVIESIFGRELSLGKQLGLAGMLQSVAREARARLPARVGV